jgi:hypothetical protein
LTTLSGDGRVLENEIRREHRMRTINVFKAQPFSACPTAGEVESVSIIIDRPLPEKVYKDLDEWRQVAKKEAQTLCDALCGSLPQGVADALLVELLDRKRSLFIVPMPAPLEPAASPLRESILRAQHQAELESSLRTIWSVGYLAVQPKGLHVVPFEEWLVKRAIDGDPEADELLGLRQGQN